jgi:hypothetical protein
MTTDTELIRILRDISSETRNEVGDLWSTSWCDDAADRLEELLQWHEIRETGLPPEGGWYDTYTYNANGHRIVRELFFDGADEDGQAFWLGEGDWEQSVTHWRHRPEAPMCD